MLADPGSIERLYAEVHAIRTGQIPLSADTTAGAAGPLPSTTLDAHHDRSSQTWSLEGAGPLTPDEAADLVGHSNVTVRPVIDLAQNLTATGYVAPPLMREQLALLNNGVCTFPYCDRPSRRAADYDHHVNYDQFAPPGSPGSTCSRYGHLACRTHHRVKTFAGWHIQSPSPGTWVWTDPRKHVYLVTGGETTQLS